MSSGAELTEPTSVAIENGVWDVCKYLFGQSSLSGVSQIAKSPTVCRRCIWVFVFCLCIGFCIYHSVSFVTSYLEYPVIVNLDVENNLELEFPAVTVCNLNGLRKSVLMLQQHVNPNEDLFNLLLVAGILSMDYPKSIIVFPSRSAVSSCKRNDQDKSQSYSDIRRFFNILHKLNTTLRQKLGHQAQDFIKKCTWMDEDCSYRNFTIFTSYLYGNCFTFNADWSNTSETKKVKSVGALSGLTLELNLERDEYLDEITSTVGARVVVHDSRIVPQPENEGIDISPGLQTSVMVSKVTFERLPPPYKDRCRNYHKDESHGPATRHLDCFFDCLQDLSLRLCNCTDPSMKLREVLKYVH
ncbi:acid-sensing ion channel 4-A-like [Tachypleus tridentatus]|uniref:acid-sensing ion channel 4-A-like n=1 Tax=Tachypleus tridentatus TaxID=6853 RepID=UPI003FD1E0D1